MGLPTVSRPSDLVSIVDSQPLRGADPRWIADLQLVSRLGASGMADVFYALGPTGGPVAVKLLRPTGTPIRPMRSVQRPDAANEARGRP
jgi:hypothetical protein